MGARYRATRWQAIVAILLALSIQPGGMAAAASMQASPVTLENFLYFTTDDKIVVDFKFNERTVYTLDYAESSNEIIIELPQVMGEGFYTDEQVNDSVLHTVTVAPLVLDSTKGLRVVLGLRHKVPSPLAFHVSQGRRLLVEAKKDFREGFETFVAPGIAYGHWRKDTPNGPLFVNYMRVDPSQPGVKVGPRMAANGKEAVHQLANRYGAIAAVNGIYFASDGSPLGMVMIDGKLISPPYLNRTAMGIKTDGTFLIDNVAVVGEVQRVLPVWPPGQDEDEVEIGSGDEDSSRESWPIDGTNRRRLADELIVYTSEDSMRTGTNIYGWEIVVDGDKVIDRVQGNAIIPRTGYVLSGHGKAAEWLRSLEVGDSIVATWSLVPDWPNQDVLHALGGGPRLLRAGQIDITAEMEKFQADITRGRAPRTALGITASGELLLVTVNGRQNNISIGMTLLELAELLGDLGAVDAMNLDGGGSSTMVVRDVVLNAPSDGQPRPVSNALLVWASGGTY